MYIHQRVGMGGLLDDLAQQLGFQDMAQNLTQEGARALRGLLDDPAFMNKVDKLRGPIEQAARDGATDAAIDFLPYGILLGSVLISINILSIRSVIGGRKR